MKGKGLRYGVPSIQPGCIMRAFEVIGINPKITHIPNWVRVVVLGMVRSISGSKVFILYPDKRRPGEKAFLPDWRSVRAVSAREDLNLVVSQI